MREYITVVVDQDLLPQVAREILSLADDPNQVEVTHGDNGQVLLVEPDLADRWLATVDSSDPDLPPAKKKIGRPRKIASASPSED